MCCCVTVVAHSKDSEESPVSTKNCNTEEGRRYRLETPVSLRTSPGGSRDILTCSRRLRSSAVRAEGPLGHVGNVALDVQKPEQQTRQQAAESSFPSCTCSARRSACAEDTFRTIDRDGHRERHHYLLSLRACSSACHSLVAFHAAWPWLDDRSKNDTHLVVVTPLSKRVRICVEHPRFAFFGFNHDVVLPSADSRYTEVRDSVKLLQMNNTVTCNRSAMLPATGILPAPLVCVYVNVCDSHISGLMHL